MKAFKPSPFVLRHRILAAFLVVSTLLIAFAIFPAHAVSFPVGPSIQITSTTNVIQWEQGGVCTYQGFFYSFFGDSTAKAFYMATSTDGVTYTTPTAIFTMSPVSGVVQWALHACDQQYVVLEWEDSTGGPAGTGKNYYEIGTIGNAAFTAGTQVNGYTTNNGYTFQGTYGNFAVLRVFVTNFGPQVYIMQSTNVATTNMWVVNGVIKQNFSVYTTGAVGANGMDLIYNKGGTWMISDQTGFQLSGDGISWPNSLTSWTFGTSFSLAGSPSAIGGNFIVPFSDGGTTVNIEKVTAGGSKTNTQVAATGAGNTNMIGSDGTNLLYISTSGSSGNSYYSTDGGGTWTSQGAFTGGASSCTTQWHSNGLANNACSSLEQFIGTASGSTLGATAMAQVKSTSTYKVFAQTFGTVSASAASVATQTIGSCPTKNTATFTPVNSTIYLYTGNALGNEVVNTISTSVASVTSGTHTLRLLIYVATTSTVSVASPLNKAYERAFTVTAGTVNQVIVAQVNVQLGGLVPIFGGNTWAVGLVADDHFRINQSGLSGLTTLTGAASTSTQPSTFSTVGTSSGSMIYLCAIASYQTILTLTTTTTQAATTTVTSTATSTITTLDVSQGALTGTNLMLLVIVLLGPALVTAGVVGAAVHSASAAGIGFIAGLALGAGIGNQAGVVPLPLVFLVILVIIFMLVGVFVYVRSGGSG